MNIIKDFSDRKIVSINELAPNTSISFTFYISKKIPQSSLALFFNTNVFFVKQYIYQKYKQNTDVDYFFDIQNENGFYVVNVKLSFENSIGNKHSQELRDTLYLLILGVDEHNLFNSEIKFNFKIFISKLLKEQSTRINSHSDLANKILKKPEVNSFGFSMDTIEQLYRYLNANEIKKIMKLYVSSCADVFNFMFKKDMFAQTSFQNYSGFFDALFNKVFASYSLSTLNDSNMSFNKFSNLKKLNNNYYMFSIVHEDLIIKQLAFKALNTALPMFLSIFGSDLQYELDVVENSTLILNLEKQLVYFSSFWNFFDNFVKANLVELIEGYEKYILSLIEKNDVLELLRITHFSSINEDTVESTLRSLQSKLPKIVADEIVMALKYR